jgi:hypothetical protein
VRGVVARRVVGRRRSVSRSSSVVSLGVVEAYHGRIRTTCFTPSLSLHSYVILWVRVVHCRYSDGNCLALSAWVSAFWAPVMRVTTISQEETGCGQADCSIMPCTCKLHGPASHCALAFLLDAALPSAGGNSQKYAKSMLFEGTKMLGALIMWFAGRDQHMQVHHRECCSMS